MYEFFKICQNLNSLNCLNQRKLLLSNKVFQISFSRAYLKFKSPYFLRISINYAIFLFQSWNSVHNAWSKCPDSKPSFSIPPRWTRSNGEWTFEFFFFFSRKVLDELYFLFSPIPPFLISPSQSFAIHWILVVRLSFKARDDKIVSVSWKSNEIHSQVFIF